MQCCMQCNVGRNAILHAMQCCTQWNVAHNAILLGRQCCTQCNVAWNATLHPIDIHKSISSVRNVCEKKPMAPVKMSENTNKTVHMNQSYWLSVKGRRHQWKTTGQYETGKFFKKIQCLKISSNNTMLHVMQYCT